MKIRDIVSAGKISFSCEVFPPKKESEFAPIESAVREIALLRPDFMSVTCGAGGSAGGTTGAVASLIKNGCGVTALAHLTCVSATRSGVAATLEEFAAAGVENVLALRGDIPAGTEDAPRDYLHASDLILDLRARRGETLCIGGACYPEGHPESPSRAEDIRRLKEKVDCGLDFLTTQMFFDNSVLYSFLSRIRAAGVHVPVLAGIMPVTNAKQIGRIIALSGTSLPPRFRMILDKFGGNSAAMKQAGIAYATEQIIDLVANGVEGIHLYTMNKPDIAARIKASLSDILG